MENKREKFLKISLSDNDFWWQLESACVILADKIKDTPFLEYLNNRDISKVDENIMSKLKSTICEILIQLYRLDYLLYDCFMPDPRPSDLSDYFRKYLEVSLCYKENIPEWNNCEDFYICLTDNQNSDSLWHFCV